MDPEDPKNATFIKILCNLIFALKSGQISEIYRVKLNDMGFNWKPHFWNREKSYVTVPSVVFVAHFDLSQKIVQETPAVVAC